MGTPGPRASSHAGNGRRSQGTSAVLEEAGGELRVPRTGCIPLRVHQSEPGACPGPNPVTVQVPEPAPRTVTSPAPCSVTSSAPQRRSQSPPWLWGGSGQSSSLHPEIRRVRGTGFGSRTVAQLSRWGLQGGWDMLARIPNCQQPLSTHLSACCSPGLCRDPRSLFLLNPSHSGQSGTALGPAYPQFLLGQHSTTLSLSPA